MHVITLDAYGFANVLLVKPLLSSMFSHSLAAGPKSLLGEYGST
jgi:hypothetical protein